MKNACKTESILEVAHGCSGNGQEAMVRYRYTQFDEQAMQEAREQQLKKLFLQLLMHTGGNVDKALEWLKDLADRYNLWGDDMTPEQFKETLQEEGYITPDKQQKSQGKTTERQRMRFVPTPKAERAIRTDAFHEMFATLKQDSVKGDHITPYSGAGGDRLPETRPYIFGDDVLNIDYIHSFSNMIQHSPSQEDLSMTEDDLSVFEVEHTTSCATVLALDVSHSMILYGEDRITPAKKVALALTELIQTRYRKDSLEIILFGDDAMLIDASELPYVSVGPYHTNTKAALEMGQQLLLRKKHANKQIVMITDGKPSAITVGGKLYVNSFGLDARIVNATVDEAQSCRRKGIVITTFMIASDTYLQEFVERLTQANKGRAYYADLENLGRFLLVDYVKNRRKQV